MLEPEFQVVGVESDGRSLMKLALALKPDVVVLDIAMPPLNGLDAAQQIKQKLPSIKLVFLTMNQSPEVAADAFRRGASGYVLKQSAAEELVSAIRTVLRGESYLSPLVARRRSTSC
jgi:DNA-binding NarL/FixJ family response regulator